MKKRPTYNVWSKLWLLIAAAGMLFSSGCTEVVVSDDKQLAEFNDAGAISFALDTKRLIKSEMNRGPYRVVPNDLVELQMPMKLQMVNATSEDSYQIEECRPYVCRVDDNGAISLPIVGVAEVAGKTLLEIEAFIKSLYCPRYVITPPTVVTSIKEYKKPRVSVTGAVNKPGVYDLRSDQMSVVSVLMEAGGIVDDGAAMIRIIRSENDADGEPVEPLMLPVKGMNMPFADVSLKDGDILEIEHIENQVFTVMGLVKKEGSFKYPPDAEYNLLNAIAFAGGINSTADPRYARIYRQAEDGSVVDATFSIQPGRDRSQALNVKIKPGDVISLEPTNRTKMNLLLADVLNIRAGLNASYMMVGGTDVRQVNSNN